MSKPQNGDNAFGDLFPGGTRIVHVATPDLDGSLRERRINLSSLQTLGLQGLSFANVLHKWDLADTVFADGPYRSEDIALDPSSRRTYPFEPDAQWIIGDFTGPSAQTSPRRVLQRQIDEAKKLGLTAQAAFEFEWLVFNEDAASLRAKNFENLTPFAPDNRCWDSLTAASYGDIVAHLQQTIEAADLSLWGLGMELGKGCLEATLASTEATAAADNAALFKLVTKAHFRREGRTACFMAQSDGAAPGLSGHINLSFRDASGRNVFLAESGQELSETALHFIGGVLECLPETLPLVAHTANAYRRMSPGNWAPRTATWSYGGYTAAVRAVLFNDALTRLEFRIPAADVNPWLGLAMFMGAGLHGIRNKIVPPAAVEPSGNESSLPGVEELPSSLAIAVDRMEASQIAKTLFGDEFIRCFVSSRRHEANALRRAVSVPEKTRYFEVA